MRIAILSITLFVALLVSGCTQSNGGFLSGLTGPSLESLVLNPEEYVGQTVTLRVSPWPTWLPGDLDIRYRESAEDEEGKPHYIYLKYERFYCVTCEVTGVVKSTEVCRCMGSLNECNYPYCPQDLETETVYYIDVEKVKKIG